MMHSTNIFTEGLPLRRREMNSNGDLLFGADFLSILMNTPFANANPKSAHASASDQHEMRRSIKNVTSSESTPNSRSSTTEIPLQNSDNNTDSKVNSTSNVIRNVRISSSVKKTVMDDSHPLTDINDDDNFTTTEIITTLLATDKSSGAFFSELPILISKATKSDFNVEESEPITQNNPVIPEYERTYPAKVEPLDSQPGTIYNPNAQLLSSDSVKSNKQPVHHTVIYHDDTKDANGARSVSYSSILQTLPQLSAELEKPVQHERHERNYNGGEVPYVNHFVDKTGRRVDENRQFNLNSENKSSIMDTRTSSETESWQIYDKSLGNHGITERNWEAQEKPQISTSPKSNNLPKVYGHPEQNYEVDEAVSIETNGRAHGIQSSLSPRSDKKHDDNQKVGYVVEGRNYRKYRVEERTADGFIVGEYGVVSHNDGSLRGVRYTADGTINPRVISDALMKFLSL